MVYLAFNNIAVDVGFRYKAFIPVESETKLTYYLRFFSSSTITTNRNKQNKHHHQILVLIEKKTKQLSSSFQTLDGQKVGSTTFHCFGSSVGSN